MQFETAVHLCACGCRSKVVTPFGLQDWILTFDGTVSLRPSIGNGQQLCRSHYNVRNNRIEWLPQISTVATRAASFRDRAMHMGTISQPTAQAPWWQRIWNRIRRPGQASERHRTIANPRKP
ncbi:DUF6527 family protein [Nonomuraea sp. WAC 01424]|uniref:DUF6527 family protein n=1 Tax=Nonomuraea sp. WAC 01424 TaxID=2203200 RepID=UPI0037CA2DAF